MRLSLNAEYMEISKVNHHEWPVVNMPVCNNCCCFNCRVMTRALSFNANSKLNKLTTLLIIPHPSHTLCGIFSGRLSTCHCHRPQSLNRPQGLHHDNVRNTKSKKLSGVALAQKNVQKIQYVTLSDWKQELLPPPAHQSTPPPPPININANHTICWACADCDLLQPTVCAERRCERSPAR